MRGEENGSEGKSPRLVLLLDEKDIDYDIKLISRGKPMSNNRNYSNSSLAGNRSMNSMIMGYSNSSHNDNHHVVETY